jgi:transcriptional regulator with XRE-family HTH domain
MTARDAFGSRLQQQRERFGVTLESIVQTTKIGRSLLAALERGDLSRWPPGIYRRSFLRAYARAIGLPPEALLEEARRLCPEPGQEQPPADAPARLRLSLEPEPRWPARARQCLAAALDIAAILLAGYGLAAWSGAGLWPAAAFTAVSYHAAGTLVLGQSLCSWGLSAALVGRMPRAITMADLVATLRHHWLPDVLRAARQTPESPAEAIAGARSLR